MIYNAKQLFISDCTNLHAHQQCMGREVGGGFRMGNMCTPVADACLCMAKPIQYCKVKNNNNKKNNFPQFAVINKADL